MTPKYSTKWPNGSHKTTFKILFWKLKSGFVKTFENEHCEKIFQDWLHAFLIKLVYFQLHMELNEDLSLDTSSQLKMGHLKRFFALGVQ